jgi:AraC family transcriptional regulator, regulatory protein of adaptative response / DNA-3-methyladenine glycosylase II
MTDGRELAESLVDRLRREPQAFADVQALARHAGITSSALDALLHEHYHASAASILRRARVQAGLGDDSDFLAVHALARTAYRRLGRSKSFTLSLPQDFHPAIPLRWLGRDVESRTERVAGSSMVKALMLDGTAAMLRIDIDVNSAKGSVARCVVDRTVSAGGMHEAHAAAVRMLGLGVDPAPFERRVARDPRLRRLIDGRRGLRVPVTSTIFEALIWTIAGQQVNLAFAYRLRRVVIELAGAPAGGQFIAHPTAAGVARLDYDDLTRRQWSRRKAEYVIDVARAVASGTLDANALSESSATSVRETLESLRGFGVWSANYVMMRGCGFADCVPLGDSGLASALEHFFALGHRPDRAETDALMRQFTPWRSLATFHFWAGGFDD